MKNINIAIVSTSNTANAITHDGIFHADEVFGTILLIKALGGVRLMRTIKVPEGVPGDVVVYDIGGGKFDHHQRDFSDARENGIKYSSFGLLWREYGMKVLEGIENAEAVFQEFERSFVEGIDAIDNGQLSSTEEVKVMTVSAVISAFNPNWDEKSSSDDCFLKAVSMAAEIFENALNGAISKVKAHVGVEAAIEASEGGIMNLDRFMPWQDYLFTSTSEKASEVLYVVFPSNRGGYNVQAVPDAPGSFGQRKPLPEAWAGLRGAELAEASGVANANFCHLARFICAADTLEDAMSLAQKAIEA